MKKRFSKALLLPAAMLYVLAAAYTPIHSAATPAVISDQDTDPSDDPAGPGPSTDPSDPFAPFSPNSLPFPICTTCDSGGGDDLR